jgi:hypothetical protein
MGSFVENVESQASCFSSLVENTLPGDVFGDTSLDRSTMSTQTTQACGNQYPTCFQENDIGYITNPGFITNNAVCRTALTYRIPSSLPQPSNTPTSPPFNSILSCPASNPCSCQFPVTSLNPNISFTASITQEACCQACTCYGDPHCSSFTGTADNWVVCDGRAPNSCEIEGGLCAQQTWGGEACIYSNDKIGNQGCSPNTNVAPPMMLMYAKTYGLGNYMSVTLQLGNLGNIVCVYIVYGSTSSPIDLTFCTSNYGGQGLPANPTDGEQVGTVPLAAVNAATQVNIVLTIDNPGKGLSQGLAERFEISVSDEDPNISTETRSGFCQTGVISEKPGDELRTCTPSDGFIFQRLCWSGYKTGRASINTAASNCNRKSKIKKTVQSAKRQWCNQWGSNPTTCFNQLWYMSICDLLCGTDSACMYACLLKFTEDANEVIIELAAVSITPTFAPTVPPTPCPAAQAFHPWPAAGGTTLPNSNQPSLDSYFLVQQQEGAAWSEPLIWFTTDQLVCGQFVLDQTGILSALNTTYRVLQCQVPSDTCGSNIVNADISVTYYAGPAETSNAGSVSLKDLYASGNLVCRQSDYPNCPPDYMCCMWTTEQYSSWAECMATYHPGASSSCQPSTPTQIR